MARDGNGNFTRLYDWEDDRDNGIKILASKMDAEMDGMATALTNSLDRSAGGGGNILRNVDMTTHKFTSLSAGSALTDSVNYDQVQSGEILFFGTTGGTSTVYTLAPSPSINAYDTGMKFLFKVNADSGASPTLNISAKGAKNLKKFIGTDGSKIAIAANELQTGVFYEAVYDGTDVVVISPVTQASFSLRGMTFLKTTIIPVNGSDADHDIDFSDGSFEFSGGDGEAYNSSTITKQIDATWAAGTNAGGLADGVSLANSTWYHLHALSDITGSIIDFGFDTSVTAANLLADSAVVAAGLTKYKRIGAVLTDGSSNILPGTWKKIADGQIQFLFSTFITQSTSMPGSVQDLAITVPPGVQTGALFSGEATFASAGCEYALVSKVQGGQIKAAIVQNVAGAVDKIVSRIPILTNTSQAIQHGIISGTSQTLSLILLGYIEYF